MPDRICDPYGLRDEHGNYTPRTKLAAQLYASTLTDPIRRITDDERERFLAMADDLLS